MKKNSLCRICVIIIPLVFSTHATQLIDHSPRTLMQGMRIEEWPMFQYNAEHTGYTLSSSPDTNSTLWILDETVMNGTSSSPAVVNNQLYIGSSDNKMHCFNATSGDHLWSFETLSWIDSSPAVYNNLVFFGSWDTFIYCLDAENGSLLWRYPSGNWIIHASPTVYDDKLFMCSTDGRIYCFDPDPFDDGIDEGVIDPVGSSYDLLWSYQTMSQIESSPAIDRDQLFILSDGLYCLNAQDGSFLWRFQWWDNGPFITPSNGTRGYQDRWGLWSSPVVTDGFVYFIPDYGEIFCLNTTAGEIVWRVPTDEDGVSSPALSYGNLYVATSFVDEVYPFAEHGMMYCLNASTGQQQWNFSTNHFLYSSPAISDGKIYFGSFDNYTYCLDAYSGDVLWSYETDGWVTGSPAIADGRLFISTYHEVDYYSNYGRVYCFEDPSYELKIVSVTGGFGLTVEVSNIGSVRAEHLPWSLCFQDFLIFYPRDGWVYGTIDEIQSGTTTTIYSGFLLGLGKGRITLTVDTLDISVEGYLFGPFVFLQ